ncbi:hypothetical protein ACFZDK_53670 [Streptomyces sp. NPDC007901]|uniref:hypothetical protein n=1 Tax=Streptomyces sp. NPDC007901 TaxID=3364785 RepID=UPI0036EAEFD2
MAAGRFGVDGGDLLSPTVTGGTGTDSLYDGIGGPGRNGIAIQPSYYPAPRPPCLAWRRRRTATSAAVTAWAGPAPDSGSATPWTSPRPAPAASACTSRRPAGQVSEFQVFGA